MKGIGKRAVTAACGLLLAAASACGNGLQVTNVTVSKRDDTTAYVKFDIAWQHSWRFTNINHDAAWVFFKVQPEGATGWQHVTLEGSGTQPADYSAGSGTAIDLTVPADRTGLFVRRAAQGSGTLAATGVQAVWNIASNGLAKSSRVRMQAMAVEMVYAAEGSFAAGSGGSESGAFTLTTISTPDASAAPSGTGALGGQAGGYPAGQTAPNALWPNGYRAFYCMKTEVTEGQWVDFFNTLTDAQKATRDITTGGKNSDGVVNRNTVAWSSGDATSAARDRACSYLAWVDCAAFADWAALRPMTELEFEKVCRGPQPPLANEYVWGNTTIGPTAALANDGTGSDTATGGNCNYASSTPKGPFRAGIFATASSSRAAAGASYWGVLDLGGSLWEKAITIGNATGRAFTGAHGDGELDAAGNANVTAWPGIDAAGNGFRGGGFNHDANPVRTSDRLGGAVTYAPRCVDYGFRAVRTAPDGVMP